MSIELSVVVPIFNEEEVLWDMAERLSVHLDKIVGKKKWQYILVDNGSKDETPKIVERIIKQWPTCVPVHLVHPNIGRALAAGLKNSEGDWALIINADWWDPLFINWSWANRKRYDLILGSKRADFSLYAELNYRRLLSWGLNFLLQSFFGFVGSDTHGQKLLHLSTMRPILKDCVMTRGQYDTELTLRAMRKGLWLAEAPVPVVWRKPRNWMIKKISQNLLDIVRLWFFMRKVPFSNAVRYHRWARDDMKNNDNFWEERK